MDHSQELDRAWAEFVVTVGMLYTAATKRPVPINPVQLLEVAVSAGVIPSNSIPLLRNAVEEYSNLSWIHNDSLAHEQCQAILLEMYKVTGWAGSWMVKAAFENAHFATRDADETPLNWSKRPSGFFAQSGPHNLYVVTCFTRAEQPDWTTGSVLWRLLGSEYDTMTRTPDFADRLPVAVVVQTGAPIAEESWCHIEEGYLSAPAHYEFMVPLECLAKLPLLIPQVFGVA